MNKHKSNKIKENSNTVRHLIMGQIITTQNLVATKVVRLAGQIYSEALDNGTDHNHSKSCCDQSSPARRTKMLMYLSGEPDYFGRNKILSGYDLSHYQVPHCIRVFFYFVWFVFIHHNFQFYFKLCTYCNILDIYLS